MTTDNNAYIGIDIGTSGCRAIAISNQGDIIAQSQHPLKHSISLGNSNETLSEQNPHYLWSVVLTVLDEIMRSCTHADVKAISVDATSGSVMLASDIGEAISPILLYNDSRAVEQSKLIASQANETTAAIGPTSGLAKLCYLEQYTTVKAPHYLLHQADWVNLQLGADIAITDENNALKTGYDPLNRQWPDWLEELTDPNILPKVVSAGTNIGHLSDSLCQRFKLKTAPSLMAGTTDSIAALIATGCTKEGDAVTSLGSTLVIKLISKQPIFLAKQGLYSHRLGNKWLIGGASNTGGAVLKHYFTDRQLEQLSNKIKLGESTYDYYPLLTVGERFPIFDAKLQPKMTPRPSSDLKFLHSLLQSIANIELMAYQQLQDAGTSQPNSVRTVGGGAKNKVWRTLREQTLNIPIITPEHTEAAYGSALIANGVMDKFLT